MKLDGTYASPFLKLHCRPRPGRSIMSRDGGQDPSVLLHAAWSHHPRASWIKYSGCYSCCRVGCSKCVGRLWMSGKQFFYVYHPAWILSWNTATSENLMWPPPPWLKRWLRKKKYFVDGALSQQGAAQTRCWKEWELWTRGLFARCRVWPFEEACVERENLVNTGLMWVRPNSCISKKLLWKELCLVEARLCECRPIPVFQRYGLMWVPPNLCVSQKALWKGDIWSRPDYVGSARFLCYKGYFWIGKDVLKPDLCQYRPIRECEGRLFRKETCLETKIMLKTGPF